MSVGARQTGLYRGYRPEPPLNPGLPQAHPEAGALPLVPLRQITPPPPPHDFSDNKYRSGTAPLRTGNLEILKELPDEYADLIYAAPLFNSRHNCVVAVRYVAAVRYMVVLPPGPGIFDVEMLKIRRSRG